VVADVADGSGNGVVKFHDGYEIDPVPEASPDVVVKFGKSTGNPDEGVSSGKALLGGLWIPLRPPRVLERFHASSSELQSP
jgi:hypothetical protein